MAADYAYRLCVRPRPDFDLCHPSSITAQAGTHVPITVHAIRKDGFDGDIALELENPPPGFALTGAWVPGGQDKARLTLLVPPEANREPVTLQINGHSTLRGRRISRPDFPADEMTQAFSYQHLMPTKDRTIFVTGNSPGKPPCSFADTWLRVPLGGTVMPVSPSSKGRNPNELRFELSGPPEGITAEDPVALGNGLAISSSATSRRSDRVERQPAVCLVPEHTYVPKGKKPTTSRARHRPAPGHPLRGRQTPGPGRLRFRPDLPFGVKIV